YCGSTTRKTDTVNSTSGHSTSSGCSVGGGTAGNGLWLMVFLMIAGALSRRRVLFCLLLVGFLAGCEGAGPVGKATPAMKSRADRQAEFAVGAAISDPNARPTAEAPQTYEATTRIGLSEGVAPNPLESSVTHPGFDVTGR